MHDIFRNIIISHFGEDEKREASEAEAIRDVCEHDCHLSPEDGCTTCDELWEEKERTDKLEAQIW